MKDDLTTRLEKAIEFIEDSQTFKVGDFVLGAANNGRVSVNGYLNVLDFENIQKNALRDDLSEMIAEFNGLISKSKKFSDFANKRGIDYYLLYDTGKAGLEICSEVEGVFKVYI